MTVALSDTQLLTDMLRPLHSFQNPVATASTTSKFYTLRKPVSATINTLANALYQVHIKQSNSQQEQNRTNGGQTSCIQERASATSNVSYRVTRRMQWPFQKLNHYSQQILETLRSDSVRPEVAGKAGQAQAEFVGSRYSALLETQHTRRCRRRVLTICDSEDGTVKAPYLCCLASDRALPP